MICHKNTNQPIIYTNGRNPLLFIREMLSAQSIFYRSISREVLFSSWIDCRSEQDSSLLLKRSNHLLAILSLTAWSSWTFNERQLISFANFFFHFFPFVYLVVWMNSVTCLCRHVRRHFARQPLSWFLKIKIMGYQQGGGVHSLLLYHQHPGCVFCVSLRAKFLEKGMPNPHYTYVLNIYDLVWSGFMALSTIVGYVMPNPLYTHILDIYDLVLLGFMAYQPL